VRLADRIEQAAQMRSIHAESDIASNRRVNDDGDSVRGGETVEDLLRRPPGGGHIKLVDRLIQDRVDLRSRLSRSCGRRGGRNDGGAED
jgi:hypothetical protein